MQVEVLGISLPWRDIYTREGPGARLYERTINCQKDTNPFLSGTDTNPFGTTLSNDKVSKSVQPDTFTNPWVDLLSGENTASESISQPATEMVVHEGGDILSFLDDHVMQYSNGGNDSKSVRSQDSKPSDTGAEQYINCFKLLAGPRMVC